MARIAEITIDDTEFVIDATSDVVILEVTYEMESINTYMKAEDVDILIAALEKAKKEVK